MRLSSAPLFWDLDAQGNISPTVVPGVAALPVTFNLSGLDGRTEDLWNYIQAIWVHVDFTLTAGGTAAVVNAEQNFRVVDSFNVFSPVLGDVLAQKDNKGPEVGHIDGPIGAGYLQPVPYGPGTPAAPGAHAQGVYFRIPLGLDCYRRPTDFGPWAPLFEKGRVVVYIAPLGTVFGTLQTLSAAAVTVRAAFEILPFGTPQIHSPSKFVHYEFPTSGVQLKILSFGNGSGFLGVNAGARLAMLLWLSSLVGLGGVGTPNIWTRFSLPWRHQRVVNNTDFAAASFLAGGRARVVGDETGTLADDSTGWPYLQSTPIGASVLAASLYFFPIVWPGRESRMSAEQKQTGDLQIDAGFTATPNGTHIFRTLEHYSFQPAMVGKIMGLMGFDTTNFTAQAKPADNHPAGKVAPGQQWGLPLRILPRSQATAPLIGL